MPRKRIKYSETADKVEMMDILADVLGYGSRSAYIREATLALIRHHHRMLELEENSELRAELAEMGVLDDVE